MLDIALFVGGLLPFIYHGVGSDLLFTHQEKPYNSLCYKEIPKSLKHIYILTEVQIVIRELFVTQIC